MKICIAQADPIKGNVPANLESHVRFIELALTHNSEAIFFPELSLTGYEPILGNKLAINLADSQLDIFQQICDKNNIIIGLGMPTRYESQIRISMIIFEPNKPRYSYSKQQLHSDEYPFFESGVEQVIIKKEGILIAPAICYESLQPSHVEKAHQLKANIYLASVAKSAKGLEKACAYYPTIAKQYKMPVLMANCVGFCDNFLSEGQTAVWTKEGKLVAQLDNQTAGLLIFDTETEEATVITIN